MPVRVAGRFTTTRSAPAPVTRRRIRLHRRHHRPAPGTAASPCAPLHCRRARETSGRAIPHPVPEHSSAAAVHAHRPRASAGDPPVHAHADPHSPRLVQRIVEQQPHHPVALDHRDLAAKCGEYRAVAPPAGSGIDYLQGASLGRHRAHAQGPRCGHRHGAGGARRIAEVDPYRCRGAASNT